MRVTAKVDYAVRAALVLAASEGAGPLKGEHIAEAEDLPLKYLENILAEMRQAGLVRSQRGAEGGYWLARPPADVPIGEIIRAVEGPLAHVRGERPENLHYQGDAAVLRELWIAVRASLRRVLDEVTLADLLAGELPPAARRLLEDDEAWR